jgi:hypothetical protein
VTTIYFAGGEDSEFYAVGIVPTIVTSSSYIRTSFARMGFQFFGNGILYITHYLPFSASSFWHSQRVCITNNNNNSSNRLLSYADSSNIERLRLAPVSSNVYQVLKVDASGTTTQLGSNFNLTFSGGVDKLDTNIVYNASGLFALYLNGVLVFSYSGDVTTNSVTSLSYVRLGCPASSPFTTWSECIVADTDTRSMSLQTLAPVANGNTHNFDTGSPAASNVNEITLNDATLDGSTTAGQIDEYTIPAIVGGTLPIVAVGVSARMQCGTTGPQHADIVVRSGSTDYLSSNMNLTLTWSDYQNWWMTDPNTSAPWLALPVNIGIKSIT